MYNTFLMKREQNWRDYIPDPLEENEENPGESDSDQTSFGPKEETTAFGAALDAVFDKEKQQLEHDFQTTLAISRNTGHQWLKHLFAVKRSQGDPLIKQGIIRDWQVGLLAAETFSSKQKVQFLGELAGGLDITEKVFPAAMSDTQSVFLNYKRYHPENRLSASSLMFVAIYSALGSETEGLVRFESLTNFVQDQTKGRGKIPLDRTITVVAKTIGNSMSQIPNAR